MARALASRPEIIFGDEPTGNLDSRSGAEVLGFLRRSVDELGQTIVMVTHDPVAAAYADRVLYPGRRADRRRDAGSERGGRAGPDAAVREGVVTVWRTSLRNVVAHKGRMVLSGVAVLLSVAFVCGTLVFTDTMNTTFDKLFAATSADVTVSPKGAEQGGQVSRTGRPATLPASALAEVRDARGVRAAEGGVASTSVTVVNDEDDNIGATTGAPTIASNWTSTDRSSMKITSGHAPHGPGQIMVDADTADTHHLTLGDELRVIAVTGDHTARISGIATFQVTNPGATVVYLDTKTAQRLLLGRTGAFTGPVGDRGGRGR